MKARLVIYSLLLFLMVPALDAGAQRTTRKSLKTHTRVQTSATSKPDYDTVATAADSMSFTFSGYEKTLRSTNESFFATNHSDSAVSRLTVRIIYKDMKGRTLDSREADIDIDLPAGATRRIDLRSWDKQNVFYYHLSPKPKAAHATPYRVNVSLLAAMRRR